MAYIDTDRCLSVLIVGAGFSGLGMGRRLSADGIDDFIIVDRARGAGGVWEANTYPGCTCDVPSHLYSFSFAPNSEWSSTYSPQPEIREYLRDCVHRFGLADKVRFGVEVTKARWVEDRREWIVDTSAGQWRTRVLISAVGPISEPKLPDVTGLSTFEGDVMHSARWNHDLDLTGRRVASIGTGASAIQYVPTIVDEVESLIVVQRTAPWIAPHGKRPITDAERAHLRAHPSAVRRARMKAYWSKEMLVVGLAKFPPLMSLIATVARKHLRSQVPDATLRAQLTPDFTLGCKRIVPSNEWYPALQKPNVTVVPRALAEITAHSIIDSEGAEYEVDTIIFATGYEVANAPFAECVIGVDGGTLADRWAGSPKAYLGSTVPGFPNFFMFLGPNSTLGHSSMVYMIEAQIEHVAAALAALRQSDADRIEVRPRTYEQYNDRLDARLARSVWETGGCRSYYHDVNGRNSTIWPDWTWRFRRMCASWNPSAYVIQRARTKS